MRRKLKIFKCFLKIEDWVFNQSEIISLRSPVYFWAQKLKRIMPRLTLSHRAQLCMLNHSSLRLVSQLHFLDWLGSCSGSATTLIRSFKMEIWKRERTCLRKCWIPTIDKLSLILRQVFIIRVTEKDSLLTRWSKTTKSSKKKERKRKKWSTRKWKRRRMSRMGRTLNTEGDGKFWTLNEL